MELIIGTKEEINKLVSDEIVALVNKQNNAILGLATGSTPIGVYKNLIEKFKNNNVSFKNTITFFTHSLTNA